MAHPTVVEEPAPVPPAPASPPNPSVWQRALRRIRTPRRPVLFAELALLASAYAIYSMIRNAVPANRPRAIASSLDIWRAEQSLNIDFELWLNHTVHAVEWLAVAMSYFYAIMHFVVTGAVLVWLFWQHPGRYRAARTVLAFTTVLALFGYFFYPLAPPRLLPGGLFHDTVAIHETWGSVTSGDLQSLTNQYAAMPSMHAGWSLWCGVAIVMFARHRLVRVLGVMYPLATLIVITGTANHYVLDAVGGYIALSAGFALQRLLHGRSVHSFAQHVPAVT
ncbi:phosphatase PAP2 family protein [Jiangella asiatica]|uniref:Phosphatase PAP2 family protein n=1 Tax=Jiangella asiatica TaxID=2530372 RepID=A0A4R5CS54_9ACTN|nr:phosphatase PAP2 family protein [Jiangella asiatica]TDE00483.1 phosphatase PAP2 family protein [Jiangella asiatica]